MTYGVKEGDYEKFGVQRKKSEVIFTFEGEKEDVCYILLYGEDHKLYARVLAPKEYCVGSVRSVSISGISKEPLRYRYERNGKTFVDPYANRIMGREKWADESRSGAGYMVYGGYETEIFDWEGDCSPEIPRHQMFLYKLHIRGFSMDAGICRQERGTFRAVMEKIPYLKNLGVTTLEFMPVYEFEELFLPEEEDAAPDWGDKQGAGNGTFSEEIKKEPEEGKVNYWGYVTGNYFAVKASYSCDLNAIREWKELVRLLHKNGIECVMEMYFGEGVNPNMICDVLRFWVREYHVDGFHLLGDNIPIAAVIQDLLLSRTKIFYTDFTDLLLEKRGRLHRLFIYNDTYFYPVRKILNHVEGNLEEFICQQRRQHPVQGFVNYIAGTNGFTLMDVFSYSEKHNHANGENNTDGNNWNYSSNCGIEGRTGKRYINERRERQLMNAAAIVFFGQGVPFLLSGDEFGNSQQGNNNAYCQDNKTGWINWKKGERYQWFTEFTGRLARFRRDHPIVSSEMPMTLTDEQRKGFPDLSYHGECAWIFSFSPEKQAVGMMYCGAYVKREDGTEDDFLYVGYNFHLEESYLALPKLPEQKHWRLVLDTSRGREAFLEEEITFVDARISLEAQSVVVLVGK